MMTTAESDFRMGEAKITLNTLGGEPIIDHAREGEASDAAIEEVTFRGMLIHLVENYLGNAEHGASEVDELLGELPDDTDVNQNACLAWQTLVQTLEALKKLTIDEEIDISAADGDRGPIVDDDAVRRSAGYSESESDVAESSLQNTGRDVTDEDIGTSAAENVEFIGERVLTPALAFDINKRKLFDGIITGCPISSMGPLFQKTDGQSPDAIVVIAEQTIDATIHELRERHSLLQYRDDEEQQQQQNQNRS
jgi:hypothetical protein